MRGILLMILLFSFAATYAQTTIADQDFEYTLTSPVQNFQYSGGGYSSGNNGTGLPANANLFASGQGGWQVVNGSSVLTFFNQLLIGYTGNSIDLRVAGMSVNGTNGIDVADQCTISLSLDGGISFSDELRLTGSTSNQRWSFAAPGSAETIYDGDNSPAIFTSSTLNGVSLLTVKLPANASQVMLRVQLVNNDPNERWVIDDVRIRGNFLGTLPVHFNAVAARRILDNVKVDWSNLTETDISWYFIERSSDLANFIVIDSVRPAHNNNSSASYSVMDMSAPNTTLYYRIRSEELNGNRNYSMILRVDKKISGNISVYPNPWYPSGDELTIRAADMPFDKYNLVLTNAAGQTVQLKNLDYRNGLFDYRIALQQRLSPGVYWLIIRSSSSSISRKIMIR